MRIPEPLFPLINFGMKVTLRSPLHFLMSSSILLLTFKGRKSGRTYTTPVRYKKTGSTIHLFSSPHANWWRNLRGGANVSVTLKGKEVECQGIVLEIDADRKINLFRNYLERFPGDASYHGLKSSRRRPQPTYVIEQIIDEVTIVEITLS